MATAKFCIFAWRVLLSSGAVFILLSAPQSAQGEKTRKCYWCGPLAEQVHRSERAPSCSDTGYQVTACEEGFTHCAIVATSPPHTESRYCVKFYQDECYPLFCNSTKTWRMTCPCRGDLCNGLITEREKQAFTILSRLVTKTHNTRFQRALMVPFENNEINTSTLDVNNTKGTEEIEVIKNIDMQSDQPGSDTNVTGSEEKNDPKDEMVNEVLKIADTTVIKTNSIEEIPTVQTSLDLNESEEKIPTKVSTKIMGIKNEHMTIKNESKPTEQLPAAEALQQNSSTVDKNVVMSVTTAVTTLMTTEISTMNTILPEVHNSTKNNTGTVMSKHILAPMVSVMLYNYL